MMTRKRNKQEDYIKSRIVQLMDDMNKASDEYDKQWYNRLIQELSWVRSQDHNCYIEKKDVDSY